MARLDAELASRGIARSRTHAAKLIAEGLVTVNGAGVVRASAAVTESDVLEVASSDHYVSRAAHKLLKALDDFQIDPTGLTALDMGASTGGFTQVLLERGASRVLAVDVGHDQLAAEIASDARVHSVEGYNVRYMTPESLAESTGVTTPPQLVTGDLSFISLNYVLPAVKAVMDPEGSVVLLVKPQFEVGRHGVKGGLVTDAAARSDVVSTVLWQAWDLGLGTAGVAASPILGTHGNAEYLVHLRGDAGNPTEYRGQVDELTGVSS